MVTVIYHVQGKVSATSKFGAKTRVKLLKAKITPPRLQSNEALLLLLQLCQKSSNQASGWSFWKLVRVTAYIIHFATREEGTAFRRSMKRVDYELFR